MMNTSSTILCFGEILWDILPDRKVPGGAPMNVALHLQKLGLPVKFVSRIGQDEWGGQLVHYLDSVGFRDHYLQRDTDYPTSWAEVDMSDPIEVRYNFPDCAWDYIQMDGPLKEFIAGTNIVVYGSLVARKQRSYATLMELLGEAGYKVFDVNLRKPNYSQKLIGELLNKADLVKMNEEELQIIKSWFFHRTHEDHLLAEISRVFACRAIAVSRGDGGAFLYYEDSSYEHPGYSANVVDTIGAGDAFLAALLFGWLSGKTPEQMLAFSCATGAYMVTKSGATPDYDIRDIRKMMEKDK